MALEKIRIQDKRDVFIDESAIVNQKTRQDALSRNTRGGMTGKGTSMARIIDIVLKGNPQIINAVVDLTNYVTLDSVQSITANKVFEAGIKVDTINEFTTGEGVEIQFGVQSNAGSTTLDKAYNYISSAGNATLPTGDAIGTVKVVYNGDLAFGSTLLTSTDTYEYRGGSGTFSITMQPLHGLLLIKTDTTTWSIIDLPGPNTNGRPSVGSTPSGTVTLGTVKFNEVTDASSGDVRLPIGVVVGHETVIKNSDGANTLTVNAPGGETINGAGTFVIGTTAVQRFVKTGSTTWLSF
jgi:hypothetical protein